MEKEGGKKKKRQGLSTCILQIRLCTSVIIPASDRHVRSSVTLNATVGSLTGFHSFCLSRTGQVIPPSFHVPSLRLWWIRMKGAKMQPSRWKIFVFADILHMLYACCNETPHTTGINKYHSNTASFSAFSSWICSLTNHPTSVEHKGSTESSSSAKISSSLSACRGWAGWSVAAVSR